MPATPRKVSSSRRDARPRSARSCAALVNRAQLSSRGTTSKAQVHTRLTLMGEGAKLVV